MSEMTPSRKPARGLEIPRGHRRKPACPAGPDPAGPGRRGRADRGAAGHGLRAGLAQGWAAAVESLGNHDAWSAIRLTLIVTGIALPLNAAFGIAAAWLITSSTFAAKAC